MRRSAAVAPAVVGLVALVLAGGAAAHYPSLAYYPPTPGPDGGSYVAGGAGFVYALESDGSPVWSHGVGGEATDRPVVHRGVLAVPTVDGRVVAVEPDDGDPAWRADVGDARGRYRVAAAGGTVHVAGPGGVTALATADGATRWATALDRRVVAGPVEADDLVVVGVGRGDGAALVALGPGGDAAWRRPLPDDVHALAATDRGVLVAAGGAVRAVAPDGDRRWRARTGEVSGLSPAPGGAVVGTYDGAVVRVREGRVAWRASLNATAVAPAADPESDWVFAVTPGAVVGVRDGTVGWRTRVGTTFLAPPTVGRRVLVGTLVNRTYAVQRDGDVAWVNRYATPVGTAPGVGHDVSPPAYLARAAGTPTLVVHPDGTARRPGGRSPPLSGVGTPAVAALVGVLALAVGLAAAARWWC